MWNTQATEASFVSWCACDSKGSCQLTKSQAFQTLWQERHDHERSQIATMMYLALHWVPEQQSFQTKTQGMNLSPTKQQLNSTSNKNQEILISRGSRSF